MFPWLLDRALEHDQERILLDLACQRLAREGILRPWIGDMEQLVGSVIEAAHQETYHRLQALLTPELRARLDGLLLLEADQKLTRFTWLLQPPLSRTPAAIKTTIKKLHFLQQWNVPQWDLSCLHSNRQKRLAQLARARSNQALQRLLPHKRYSFLVAFCWQMHQELTDLIVKMFEECWDDILGRSRRQVEEYQKATSRTKDQLMRTLSQVASLVLQEDAIPSASLRKAIFERVDKEELQEAVVLATALTELNRHSHLDFLAARYSHIKQFSVSFLAALDFQNAFEGDDFFQALLLVKELQTGKRRKLPLEVPASFVTNAWKKFVFNSQKQVQRIPYELAVLSTLRDRLGNGDVYLQHSQKYTSLDSCLIDKTSWANGLQAEAIAQLGLPTPATQRLDDRMAELESALPLLEQILQEGGDIRLDEKGELVITPLEAEDIPASAVELNEALFALLPEVELTDLLVEVDRWTGFSAYLTGVDNLPKGDNHTALLYASLLASACNIPLTDMARSTGLDYQALWRVSTQYLREENLKRANVHLVNYHHQQWLPTHWGGGTLSSSDGQRFPVSGKIRNAQAIPRYFGFGKGLTFYTHSSDQYSQFGSTAIPSTVRDATYLLDEILGNETVLLLLEHVTDTAGYTDIIFALFDLLGLQFLPRLRDLAHQRLCKIKGRDLTYPSLKFTSSFDANYVRKQWDELVRLAASLKMGYVTSSILISKLNAYPRQHNLTHLLQEYGRLIKTNFILRYLQSKPLRRRINAQLNKGELLHALRAWLWFGGDGSIRKKQEEGQQQIVRSLNLLTNAVVLWNTVYLQAGHKQLQVEGYPVNEEDLAFLSPAKYAHINRLGRYSFLPSETVDASGLRPLRKTANVKTATQFP